MISFKILCSFGFYLFCYYYFQCEVVVQRYLAYQKKTIINYCRRGRYRYVEYSAETVSYTHLDVYKRQPVESAVNLTTGFLHAL